jgi:arylsulfatase A-like enzyme
MTLSRALAALTLTAALAALPAEAAGKRNVVIFVADGLRYLSVTPENAPTMAKLKAEGVDFSNSHAVFPTVTTANASAIATGHFLGDTGDYGNTLYTDFPVPCRLGMQMVFLEDDCILRDVKAHYGDGYLGQTTLMQAARKAGYDTILVGKRGPLAIQSLDALDATNGDVDNPLGIFIDEATNHPANADTTPTKSTTLKGQIASDIFAATGMGAPSFNATPNLTQQSYFLNATTQVLIPDLQISGRPFVMLFWSRDPDLTQHGALDSDGSLLPGINGTNALEAVRNADNDLRGILDALKQYGMEDNTDVFVIADHGFSTIGNGIPAADGSFERSTLGGGFLALDIAKWLGNQNIYDPNNFNIPVNTDNGEHPHGDALIGPAPDKPMAIVASNGGSDFVYVPGGPGQRATAKLIVEKLTAQPYTGALFVNDALMKAGDPKDFAGALPMSEINLMGSASVPRPAIVVGYRSFVVKGCKLGEQLCTAEIADTPLHTGQGMHGSSSRADTRNFMAAIGPDFKKKFVDTAPVGNVDVAPTLAHILGVELSGPGNLKGRVIGEVLKDGKMPKVSQSVVRSAKAANGFETVLDEQEVDSTRYFDAAGMPGRTVGLTAK